MPRIGQTISHYTILEKLGEGGMGVVYKAHDTRLHRTVALKFLSERLSPTADAETRLLIEARAAAALNHPGICSVFDILDIDEEQFIVMEFVEGDSLRARIVQGPMSIREVLDTTIQIADALAEAHRGGIVHRDIKPENVIITPAGRVKVMDFGLARKTGRTQITRDTARLGTTAYMSPEQARGETVDFRTDIWSFGVLLYEACTGVLPFAGEYDQAVVYRILNEIPRSPRTLNPALPEPLERIIHRCIEKLPENRYLTMEDCLSDLRAISAAQGSAGSPPTISRKHRQLRTRPVAIVLGIATLTVAFILFLATRQEGRGKSVYRCTSIQEFE